MVKYLAQTRGDLAALRGTRRFGWENNKQTKLKMEPHPKTKELQPIGVQLNQRFYSRQSMCHIPVIACKESSVRQPGASGFRYQASEFCF